MPGKPPVKPKLGGPAGQLAKTEQDLLAMTDPKALITWANQAKRHSIEAIDENILQLGYAAISWQFRKAAIEGNYNHARACQLWLTWAKDTQRARRDRKAPDRNITPSARFLPESREPVEGES